jgi:hypothetical protein
MSHHVDFLGRFNPSDVLSKLIERKVINDMDKENIQAEQRISGDICATQVLLDRVWRHHQNWYEEFLDALCKDYHQIVKSMDPDFYESEYMYTGLPQECFLN